MSKRGQEHSAALGICASSSDMSVFRPTTQKKSGSGNILAYAGNDLHINHMLPHGWPSRQGVFSHLFFFLVTFYQRCACLKFKSHDFFVCFLTLVTERWNRYQSQYHSLNCSLAFPIIISSSYTVTSETLTSIIGLITT